MQISFEFREKKSYLKIQISFEFREKKLDPKIQISFQFREKIKSENTDQLRFFFFF